jgi:TM2 domain-containing membrane protein YozV
VYPPTPYAPSDGIVYSSRNRWLAGALGVLLGEFGVHRFYLGYVGIGVIQIVVTLATCGIGGLWGFIEGILCFCGAMRDVDGRMLRS